MRILDFLFYHIYIWNLKEIPFFRAVCGVWFYFSIITVPVWGGLDYVFYGLDKNGWTPIGCLYLISSAGYFTIRYKRKKTIILDKYKKYNLIKMLPILLVISGLLLGFGVLCLINTLVRPYLDSHGLMGYMYDYLPEMLK